MLHSTTQPWESDTVEELWETTKIHAARVRQTAEHGRALVEDLRYTPALSQRLVQASRALLKRSKDQDVLPSLETETAGKLGRPALKLRKANDVN
ncbi:hypothetical protein [Mesorhizobium sp.]|uniref:hypothetical protein n=1 Tax=Mesorhizobium sp. TaxID=1871066 RepID=UPI000FE7DD94|nr:hypothetical protein [Mesorhizobium sp.]RWK43035.1 MAG: hypothetical protein EOR46_08230 [Mesorhizobium sp.]RWK68178.1 MAG: hypothetical protein EOR54_15240 [Mesorhizobium sp.]RWK76230.1 MAG: hypothetical protein EOR50_14615 [Mesorhizobium sp.]RWK81056.1 MAG: hypothetical protein EOR51_16565 [Mesorhizobium sp.]RWL08377.1 MAG: hypothetical protein EOR55_04280 [Mesorhizobium sp.]